MKEIKYLIKNSKYVLPFLTALSILKITLFYSAFNISIGSYLSLDEILTPMIDDLLFYGVFITIFHLLIGLFLSESWKTYNTSKSLINKDIGYWSRLKKDLITDGSWLGVIFIFSIIMIIQGISNGNYSMIFYYPVNFLILHIRREIIIKHPALLTTSLEFLNILLLMSSLTIITLGTTYSKIYSLKHLKSKKVIINYVSGTIICNDSIAYVGRIKNNTFIYDQKLRSTLILNNSDIKNVTFIK